MWDLKRKLYLLMMEQDWQTRMDLLGRKDLMGVPVLNWDMGWAVGAAAELGSLVLLG